MIRQKIAAMHAVDPGILFMLVSALLSALNGAVTKMLGEQMSALEIVFLRNLFGMALILLALWHTPTAGRGGRPFGLLMRGLFGFVAMALFFYTITAIPLGEAITLNKTSPLFVALLAWLLMRERLSAYGILALFVGFAGIAFITKPFGISIGFEHFLGLLGGFFAACAYVTIKRIRDLYDSRVIVLSFVTTGTVLPALLFLLAPHIQPPRELAFLFPDFILPHDWRSWGLVTVLGLTATLSQWLLTRAYSLGKAGIVGVVSYANIPFAVGLGWALGDPFPDIYTWMGIALIVTAGVLLKKR